MTSEPTRDAELRVSARELQLVLTSFSGKSAAVPVPEVNPDSIVGRMLADIRARKVSPDAKLTTYEDGLWLLLNAEGKIGMINLSDEDYGETANTVINDILSELQAEKRALV